MSENNTWPADIDGDVLRILEEQGFDFNESYVIEFIIEFNNWPLNKTQQDEVLALLPGASFEESDEESIAQGDAPGYVSFKLNNLVTYDFVTEEYKRLTHLFSHMGGYCDSWSVSSGCGM